MYCNELISQQPIISHTQSIHTANQCLNYIIGPHELVDLSQDQPLNFSFQGEKIGGIIMGELIYGKDVIFKTQHGSDMHYYCITRPKIGSPRFRQQDSHFEANHANAAIVSPFDKFEIEIAENCVQSFVSISKPLLEMTLAEMIGRPLDTPIHFEHIMRGENRHIQAWWNLLSYFSSYAQFDIDFSALMPEIKPDFEKMVAKALLFAQPHNYSHLLNQHDEQAPEYLKRAVQFIHQNIHHPLRIDDIEYAAGVSKQKLSKAFRERLQISPNAYIRYYRLKCIYQELAHAKDKQNITTIAMKWGVNHLGRFSLEYKQQFGESPSDTVRKAMLKSDLSTLRN